MNKGRKSHEQWGLWGAQDGPWILLGSLAFFQFSHPFIRHSIFWLDIIQLPLSLGYSYVLVVVCFLDVLKISPAARRIPLQWPKRTNLLEHVFPTRGTSSKISSDWGARFTEQIMQTSTGNLANFLELSLTQSPSIIKQGQEK